MKPASGLTHSSPHVSGGSLATLESSSKAARKTWTGGSELSPSAGVRQVLQIKMALFTNMDGE